MFDPNKPYETCAKGPWTFWSQDGVIYNPSTKEPVDMEKFTAPKKAAAASGLICKICGVSRPNPQSFREHLIVAHPETMEPQKAEPEAKVDSEPEPDPAPAPKTKAKSKRR